jgi:hypothetical protein
MLMGASGPHPAAEQKIGRDVVSVRFADPRPFATYLLGSIGPPDVLPYRDRPKQNLGPAPSGFSSP